MKRGRGPSEAEFDALAAWWLARRNIGKAAGMLGKKRQTIANHLNTFRRLEDATDNVELALKYLDDIEARRDDIIARAA